jgi:hypothetical protein
VASKLDLEDQKSERYYQVGGRCENCGRSMPFPGQWAHKIPQNVHFTKMLGLEVIHHEYNLALVCSLKCNDAMSISNHRMAIFLLVDKIRSELGRHSKTDIKETD